MSNSISFVGRLARDCETRYTDNGNSVTGFRVANDVGFGERKKTNWLSCLIWGARGEKLAQYLVKGTQVFISGELTTREWTASDNTTKTALEVNVREIDLIGGEKKPQEMQQQRGRDMPAGARQKPQDFNDEICF